VYDGIEMLRTLARTSAPKTKMRKTGEKIPNYILNAIIIIIFNTYLLAIGNVFVCRLRLCQNSQVRRPIMDVFCIPTQHY
jgi:hypothetical protein